MSSTVMAIAIVKYNSAVTLTSSYSVLIEM